jgi:hypothetical protein
MMMIKCNALLLLLGLLSSSVLTTDGAKVKRVKAGQQYADHGPVHVVVNKVG